VRVCVRACALACACVRACVRVCRKQETQLVHAVHYENINYLIFPVMLSYVVFLPFYDDLISAQ